MRKLIIALFAIVALQACTKDLTTMSTNDTKWVLTEWPGKVLPTRANATLDITGGNKINGKSFCNSYGGNAVINGSAIQFTNTYATKMYCADVAKAEDQYLSDLNKVRAGKFSGDKLHFYNDGILLMTFSKAQ